MICDIADVTMDNDYEEEKIQSQLAPTPSASHNPKSKTTGDGNEFKATKSSKISKILMAEDASEILKMSKMSKKTKNVTNSCNLDDLTNLAGNLTFPEEKVAVAEMSPRCDKMSNLQKVMGGHITAGNTHSVSEVRQINMAGNI